MARIEFHKSTNGYTAKIVGIITKGTTKLVKSYAERNKLDVQSINIIEEKPLFPTQWEQHCQLLTAAL